MDSSVLFSGLRFDQKRFGTDLQRFKKKIRSEEEIPITNRNPAEPQDESEDAETQPKKRTQKSSKKNIVALESSLQIFKSAPTPELPITDSLSQQSPTASDKNLQEVSASNRVGNKRASTSDDVEVRKKKQGTISVNSTITDNISKKRSGSGLSTEVSASKKLGGNTRARREEEEIAALRKKYRLHVAGESVPAPLASFSQLRSQYRCKKPLMKSIHQAGYVEPTPIQRQAIPVLLEHRECLACASTGSGKTLAFMIPIAMNLKKSTSSVGVRAVILCPVRELAAQTAREFRRLIPSKKLRVRVLTTALFNNSDFFKLPCDVLISTPLRLERLVTEKKIELSKVEYLILDESDKLFEMGFVEQIDSIVAACTNPKIVRALFSATLPDAVEELARTIMHDAVRVIVGEKNSSATSVDQRLLYVGSEDGKLLALRQLFRESLKPPVLLFVDSKERAKMLYRELAFEDLKVESIHSDKSQEMRDAAVEKFRKGEAWILIATDLMARGMDFKGVKRVINYDFPQSTATYIHRIGRSGRAGLSGEAVTLYSDKDVAQLRAVANVMRGAGCEVADWMLALPKVKVKKWKKK